MSDIAVAQLVGALREGFDGPNEDFGYFLDSDAGLRTTLAKLSANEASRAVGGNSVAAHAHHILFSLNAFAKVIAGDRSPNDWNESWTVKSVDDGAWTRLQQDLGSGYEKLRGAIETSAPERFGTAVGAVTHLAYHVGAIRQKIAASTVGG
jgi:hypothetical protein